MALLLPAGALAPRSAHPQTTGRQGCSRPCMSLAPRGSAHSLDGASWPARPVARSGWGNMPRAVSTHNASAATRDAEFSSTIYNELTLFILQLDFDAKHQRALNYEDFDTAAEIRKHRQQIDEAVDELQQAKGDGAGATVGAHCEAATLAAEGLRLRSEMARAAEEERYQDAAAVRDRLNLLQARLAELDAAGADRAPPPQRALRLGQRVVHAEHGYRGVVFGWDDRCCEMEEWQRRAGVGGLRRGPEQPFYHVLVDQRDWAKGTATPDAMLAYVAEEMLTAPEDPATWVSVHGSDDFRHPYSYLLFLGADPAGDLLPARQLRDKYSAPRREVYPQTGDDEEEDAQ